MSAIFTLDSPLSDAVSNAFSHSDKVMKFVSGNYDFYEARIWIVLNRLSTLDAEINIVLDEITATRSPAHAALLIKMYYVTLDTMYDVFAWLISEVFDLGYDEKQISIAAIRKNRHVMESGLPDIIKANSSVLDIPHFFRQRNDILHRGLLVDRKLAGVESKLILLTFKHPSESANISAAKKDITDELIAYCTIKKEEFQKHYDSVINFMNILMVHLAKEVCKRQT